MIPCPEFDPWFVVRVWSRPPLTWFLTSAMLEVLGNSAPQSWLGLLQRPIVPRLGWIQPFRPAFEAQHLEQE
ncbi:hypothetical protein N658DRAFT_270225 [Parathielavia hyrcaniae]|uniref:Uncharacterized protein n=1 Tax=Parathielavia hyrcaniae TaxID=113614 RepID=A0AAN6PT94_9PEZI|nr:hypothetical protein N658DRAFT_270225 [Parathielavia hyrcaniae]